MYEEFVGKKIRIIEMKDEPQYSGKTGIVKRYLMDPYGSVQLRGTWGGCAVYPEVDEIEIIEEE